MLKCYIGDCEWSREDRASKADVHIHTASQDTDRDSRHTVNGSHCQSHCQLVSGATCTVLQCTQ